LLFEKCRFHEIGLGGREVVVSRKKKRQSGVFWKMHDKGGTVSRPRVRGVNLSRFCDTVGRSGPKRHKKVVRIMSWMLGMGRVQQTQVDAPKMCDGH